MAFRGTRFTMTTRSFFSVIGPRQYRGEQGAQLAWILGAFMEINSPPTFWTRLSLFRSLQSKFTKLRKRALAGRHSSAVQRINSVQLSGVFAIILLKKRPAATFGLVSCLINLVWNTHCTTLRRLSLPGTVSVYFINSCISPSIIRKSECLLP